MPSSPSSAPERRCKAGSAAPHAPQKTPNAAKPTSTRWRSAASRTWNQCHTRACRGPSGAMHLARDLGFVVVHRCGEGFYFLLVCIWRAVIGKRLTRTARSSSTMTTAAPFAIGSTIWPARPKTAASFSRSA